MITNNNNCRHGLERAAFTGRLNIVQELVDHHQVDAQLGILSAAARGTVELYCILYFIVLNYITLNCIWIV